MYERLVRWAFARFYREFSWTYDGVAALVSAGHWRAWTLATLPYLQGAVLELGCGTGYLQAALADRPSQAIVVGLDLSRQMLSHTRRRLGRAGHTGALVRGNTQAIPFRPASFDTVVATFPSEYIVAPTTLHEARRVLRPHGRIVIAPAAQFTTDGPYQRLIDLAYRATLQRSPRAHPSYRSNDGPRPQRLPEVDMVNESAAAYLLRQRMAQAGFQTHEVFVSAPSSLVYILIGEVPG